MKTNSILIAPSVLSCNLCCLAEEIADIERGGCDWVHLDVMDGHFVPNLTFGPPVIRWIRKTTKLILDTHLMIEHPERYIEEYRKAGSDYITFHYEAASNICDVIQKIRKCGARPGLSLRPGTSIERLAPYFPEIDLILVMTVEPGFGGQSFMPDMLDKIRYLKNNFKGLISVDGGIVPETAKIVKDAGANVLVAGTAVFGQTNRAQAIANLRNA